MNTRARTITELEKKRDEIKNRLLSLEALVGHQLLASSAPSTSEQDAALYAALVREKDSLLSVITEIQRISSGRNEIKSRITEIKKYGTELSLQWDELLEKFGVALFDQNDQELTASVSSFYSNIQTEKKSLSELEQQISAIKIEMETQNLFNRLVTQVKLVTANNTAALHKRKITQLSVKLAKDAFESSLVKERYAATKFDPPVLFAYEKCLALKEEIAAQDNRRRSLLDEDSSAANRLAVLGADDNPVKRISELRNEFHSKETNIEELCRKIGHGFSNLYVTPDGEDLMPYAGPIQAFLPDIASERLQLLSCNRRIEILQLLGAVEETDKKIVSLKQSVAENNRKIERLQDESDEISRKMTVVNGLRDNLQGRLAELESIESPSAKLLSKP